MTEAQWKAGPEFPLLIPGEVHVWRAALGAPAELRGRLERTLSADERARAGRLRQPEHRAHFIVSRGVQRDILARYIGVPASELTFTYTATGKPGFANVGTDLRFNVSNSGGLALYAVALGREIGVDVEEIRPVPRALALARGFFSASEVRALHALPVDAIERAFLTCWTRKEAFVKAAGTGLSLALDRFDVGFTPGEPARLLGTRPPAPAAEQWRMHEVDAGAGYVAALVVAGGAADLSWFDWNVSPDDGDHDELRP